MLPDRSRCRAKCRSSLAAVSLTCSAVNAYVFSRPRLCHFSTALVRNIACNFDKMPGNFATSARLASGHAVCSSERAPKHGTTDFLDAPRCGNRRICMSVTPQRAEVDHRLQALLPPRTDTLTLNRTGRALRVTRPRSRGPFAGDKSARAVPLVPPVKRR
jgi:hypothetical protein